MLDHSQIHFQKFTKKRKKFPLWKFVMGLSESAGCFECALPLKQQWTLTIFTFGIQNGRGRYTKGAQLLNRVTLFFVVHHPKFSNAVAMCNALVVRVLGNYWSISNDMLFGDHLLHPMKPLGHLFQRRNSQLSWISIAFISWQANPTDLSEMKCNF